MEITLLRHGKPALEFPRRIRAKHIPSWIEAYNHAGICLDHPPPASAIALTQQCNKIICSNLNRSIESARTLADSDIDATDVVHTEALYREADLPLAIIPLLKLKPQWWVAIYRALWYLGYSRQAESFKDACQRARTACASLCSLSQRHGHVMLVGHGMMNHLIAKELLRSGWSGPQSPGHNYWDYTTYRMKPVSENALG